MCVDREEAVDDDSNSRLQDKYRFRQLQDFVLLQLYGPQNQTKKFRNMNFGTK